MGEITIKLNYQTAREIAAILQRECSEVGVRQADTKDEMEQLQSRYYRALKAHDDFLSAVEAAEVAR